MAKERLSVHNVKEVLRLRFESRLTIREIAASLGVRRSTVGDYVRRARAADVSWPLPEGLDDEIALAVRLFDQPRGGAIEPVRRPPVPNWSEIHEELRKRHVTLALLWQEYRETHPDGYSYTRFVELYAEWRKTIDVVMRQTHEPGKRAFVDFSGGTKDIVDRRTGEVRPAKLFVAVLGHSNYTYVEPVFSEDAATWIKCNAGAFEYFGGVPEILVCDNLKSGVTTPNRYEPDLNRTYEDFATHHGTAILPARVRRPRDKAKVEVGVQVAERWILAALRNRTLHTLDEFREAIEPLLERLNTRAMRHIGKSRREIFAADEKARLRPLPRKRFEIAAWKKARVHIDYHVEYDRHYYSVHYTHARSRVELRVTFTTVEVFRDGRRIASHAKSAVRGGYTTLPEHMPKAHREMLEWTPSRILAWAAQTGPLTTAVAQEIMRRRAHPEQGFRGCLGIMRLTKEYEPGRVERACERASKLRAYSYRSVENILRTGLDRQTLRVLDGDARLPLHDNVRGSAYYSEN